MTVFDDHLLRRITSNTSDGAINLREESIGDKEVKDLGAALQNNKTVCYVQLPGDYGKITHDGLKYFAEKIALRKEPLVVETNKKQWNKAFGYIEERKRSGKEVDKLADFLPTDIHNVQNDKSTSDLTDSSKSTTSLALEEDNVVQAASVEDKVVQAASEEDNVVQAASVEEELIDKAEEAKEDLTESLESLLSVDGSVDDSVDVVPESVNTIYQEYPATISSNDIKTAKIKPTSFFAKISNTFTTVKHIFDSLFNHNTTNCDSKDCDSSKCYVTKDEHVTNDELQGDTPALGCVDDSHND
ncbi:MAG: hypothetical protein LN563_01710 [Rickettsia endosymbiont of Platyusa sonomae]|nr:hypothetical protein [Rickettsia endosymbiont of Platyusa sonomae]